MNKEDLENEENKKNIEIINNLYSNNEIDQKNNLNIEHSGLTKFKDDRDSEKYIKEMHDLADKNEFKNNIVVIGLGIVVAAVIIFSIFMNTTFMNPKADVAKSNTVIKPTADTSSVNAIATPDKIYAYLNIEANRAAVLKKSITLNENSQKGLTVYLLSEILRANNTLIPTKTNTIKQLVTALTSMDWKKNTDFNELKKGDICFTTDMPGKPNVPSHAYVFMGWVEEGKTAYANVCDGQIDEFGTILHKRNLSIATTKKDEFSFFLRK